MSSGVETRTVPVGDGRELCLEIAGDPDGKPILVEPGEPMSRRLYGGWIADAERKGIRLIGIDRPGYGGSTAQPGYTVASHAHDVRIVTEALGYDRIGIWGISGGGPYALGSAAPLPDVVVATAAVASVAPYGVEGFDFLDGMGESNLEAFQLFFSDPAASRLDLREGCEEILAATPEQFAEGMESLVCRADAEVLTGDLLRWLTETHQVALSPGDQGWWMTERRRWRAGGSISATSGCRSRSGTAARTGSFPCSTGSGWPPASPAPRLTSATATGI